MDGRLDYLLKLNLLGLLECAEPLGALFRLDERNELLEHLTGVAVYRGGGGDVLVKFRRINVDVYDFGIRGVGLHIARDAVVKSHSYRYYRVGAVGVDVGAYVAVHPQHALVEPVRRRHCRQSQKGCGYRNVAFFGKLGKLFLGIGYHHAVTRQNHGAFRGVYYVGGPLKIGVVDFGIGDVGAYVVTLFVVELRESHLCVLGEVEHHRAGTACRCNVECSRYGRSYILGTAYLVAPFRDGLCDAHHIGFLEGVEAQEGGGHLTGDDHKRSAVHQRVAEAGDDIGSRRARGHYYNARASRDAGISLCGVCRALFMAHEHMLYLVLVVIEPVIYGDD